MVTMSLSEYKNVQEQRIQKIKRMKRRTPVMAAKYMATKARQLAPRKTGTLLSGIIRRKNQVMISANDPINGFPYVHFVNQSKGFESILYPKGVWIHPSRSYSGKWTKIAPPGTVAVYGQSPTNWKWTGTARFATIARNSAAQFFKNTNIRELRKSIRLEA